MTLLKFIEFQRKDTFLNKVPIPVKVIPLVYSLASLFLPIDRISLMYSLLIILIVLTLLLLIAYRDLLYISEVYFSYTVLFLIAYFSSMLTGTSIYRIIDRLLYIYSTAFSFIFFFATTKIKQLERFLERLGIPKRILNYFILTWNLIPSTYHELQLIAMTQKARGVELKGGVVRRIKNIIIILIPFLFLLLLRSRLLEYSMKARGVE